jgi:GDPmannose 4,6-dehydratase
MYGDMTDMASIFHLFQMALSNPASKDGPIEVYNLAAQSHVKVSFETPLYTSQSDAVGVLNILEAVIALNLKDKVRFYQASTSELYGSSPAPQNEDTPFQPRSPYAISKLYAYWMVRNYRDAYNMYAVNGILFNHESERRGETFVSRKITRGVASYYHTKQGVLTLGNLYALRDWGYAPDYVRAMWQILQQNTPEDYVISTGHSHTVKDFVDAAFAVINVTIRWEGINQDEKGYNAITGDLLVTIDPSYYRPTEVDHLCGDNTKATSKLDWAPSVYFEEMVKRMVEYDIDKYI